MAVHRAAVGGLGVPSVVVPEISVRLHPHWCSKELSLRITQDQAVLLVVMHLEGSCTLVVPFKSKCVVHMIHDHVNDHIHAERVSRACQIAQFLQGPQAWIDDGEVMYGVLVVRVRAVQEHWRYPNRPAPKALDVGELLLQADEIPPVPKGHVADVELAVVSLVVSGVSIRETVSQELINSERPPIFRGGKILVTLPAAEVLLWDMLAVEVHVPSSILIGARCGL
mmetsp:Transcript_91736/g.237738  ORF Transcript_91736/g.237738 Transcript_91736/m.237738 type:complete len:225 (+) Transcript_91736:1473-2147(+)